MNLWVDDTRPAPEGWIWCQSVDAAKMLLRTKNVENVSLDHDLGLDQPTGYDLVRWMVENHIWPKNKPIIHSINPVGMVKMRGLINQRGPYND